MKKINELSKGTRILYYIISTPNTYTTHAPEEGVIDEISPETEYVKISSAWYLTKDVVVKSVLKTKEVND